MFCLNLLYINNLLYFCRVNTNSCARINTNNRAAVNTNGRACVKTNNRAEDIK